MLTSGVLLGVGSMALGDHRSSGRLRAVTGEGSPAPFRTASLPCWSAPLLAAWSLASCPLGSIGHCLGASGSPVSGHWVRLQAGGAWEGLEPSLWRVT